MPTAAPPHNLKRTQCKRFDSNPRANANRRGYTSGPKWQLPRKKVFRRDIYTCQHCGQLVILDARKPDGTSDGRRRAECDHIIPKAQGGSDLPSNLQTLCGSCHGAKTRREA